MSDHLLNYIRANDIVQHGEFRLSSGRTSDLYCDVKKLILDAEGLARSVPDLFRLLAKTAKFDAVGGIGVGGSLLVGSILMHVSSYAPGMTPFGNTLKGFVVRKQPKEHGTQKFIEGPVESGMRVAIVEDVTTSGNSAHLACMRAVDFGLVPVVVGCVINRREGADELFASIGMPFVCLLGKDQLRP